MLAQHRKYKLTVMHPRSRERFWKFVEKRGPDDCWKWTGPVHQSSDSNPNRAKKGDPLCFIKGATTSTEVQRIAYEAAGNRLNTMYRIENICGNKFCCNPNHLYPAGRDQGGRPPEWTTVMAQARLNGILKR